MRGVWTITPHSCGSSAPSSERFRCTRLKIGLSIVAQCYFLDSVDAFGVIRDFLEKRFNEKITTNYARQALPSESGLRLKDASLNPTLRQYLSDESSAYLATYNPFGSGGSTIHRSQTDELVEIVTSAVSPRVVLVTGVAGSGKSGVIREFMGRLKELEITHLAIRIDQHLDCKSPRGLGKTVTGIEESPIATLKALCAEQPSVLIIDQVDAVSEASGRNGAVKHAVLQMVDEVRCVDTVRLVIVCRTFDLQSDDRLKGLRTNAGIREIGVPLLSWEGAVEPFLASKLSMFRGFQPLNANCCVCHYASRFFLKL